MHILIATAGVLPPGPVADLTERLLADEGHVSVLTVIEVPRSFLDGIESETWHPFTEGDELEPADRRAAVVDRYVEERGRKLVEPILAALRARGIEANGIFAEGADRGVVICETADQIEADLIVMGATRRLFGEAWESISTEVMQRTRLPLLLIPGAPRSAEDADDDSTVSGAHQANVT